MMINEVVAAEDIKEGDFVCCIYGKGLYQGIVETVADDEITLKHCHPLKKSEMKNIIKKEMK